MRIHFEIVGEGAPILLHTGAGGDRRTWEQASYVKGLEGFRCILMDHRGHGRSDTPQGLDAHRVERYVDDVIAVLEELAIDRTAFWGYSSGSTVGYALAAAHPDQLSRLIVSGGIGARDYDEPEERRSAEGVARAGLLPLITELEKAEGITFPAWFWRQMTDTDGEMFALEVLGEAEWHGPWSLLSRIATPVLMLVGELEDPNRDNARAAAMLPSGRCVILPGLGHVGGFLRSDLALAQAIPFLQGNWGRRLTDNTAG